MSSPTDETLKEPTVPPIDQWVTWDPTQESHDFHHSEAGALATLDSIVDEMRSNAGEGWHESTECAAAYALVPIAMVRLKTIGKRGDGTENGEICDERDWDFMAEAEIVRVEKTPAEKIRDDHPHVKTTDAALVERAVSNAGRCGPRMVRWAAVKEVFGHGSGVSASLCRAFGLDPDEMVGDDGGARTVRTTATSSASEVRTA